MNVVLIQADESFMLSLSLCDHVEAPPALYVM